MRSNRLQQGLVVKHQLIPHFLEVVDQGSVFVEVGSDRGEGSTPFLAELAASYNTILHTVDIDADRTGDRASTHRL